MQAGCGTGVGRAHGHAPRQNSPCKPPIRHTPRKNSPSTAKFGRFGLFSERWAKNIALSTQALEAGRIFSRRPPHTSHTAHTHGTKLSGHTACKAATGTKLSQHSKKHPNQPIRGEQGENYPGRDGNNRRRANFIPQTTTHQPRSAHSPVQNSPRTPPHRRPPVQNSPHTAKNTQISPFEASREKTIPVETRSRHKQPTQGEFYPADHHTLATLGTLTGTKLSGHTACKASTGTKLSRHCPMGRPPPKSHAIPSAPEPTTTQNVGISMIEFQSWKYSSGNCMRNCRASRKTAHKAGPVVIHRPRLVCISCISANASDYQARTERS